MLAGVAAVQESVFQCTVDPVAGLASFSDEVKVPSGAKPVFMKILKPTSVVTPPVVGIDQTVPLVAPETRVQPA